MHDHSPPSIGHWAMVRALLAILLFNALALGIFIASYLAYVRRPHPAAFLLCMVMPLLLLLLLAFISRSVPCGNCSGKFRRPYYCWC